MGATLQNAASCNGWTYWHTQTEGKAIPIDELRKIMREKVAGSRMQGRLKDNSVDNVVIM